MLSKQVSVWRSGTRRVLLLRGMATATPAPVTSTRRTSDSGYRGPGLDRHNQSKIKKRLNHFAETGEIIENTNEDTRARVNRKPQPYSSRKLLVLLQNRYEDKMDLKNVREEDLDPTLDQAKALFVQLLEIRKTTGKPIDRRLLLGLLGSNEDQLKDSFLVTDEVQRFLRRDNSPLRAQELARLAGPNAVMAMNEITLWHFDQGDYKAALKTFNNRKKWGIPGSPHTYVRLFDGLSKSFERGKAPKQVVETAIEIFQQLRIKHAKTIQGLTRSEVAARKDIEAPTIEMFNAALNLAVRNYDDDQDIAWSLFDILLPEPKSGLRLLQPSGESYTILLQGVRLRCFQEARKVQKDDTLSEEEKYYQLLIIQKKLTDAAESILERVLEASTPPRMPSKEEVDANPQLLAKYKRNMNKMLIDIDKHFVSVFVSCYVNKFLGTGATYESCHYLYVERGLKYLECWSPEVGDIFDCLNLYSKGVNPYLSPTGDVRKQTDSKVEAVCQKFDVDEKGLFPSGEVSERHVNPIVQFPPPPGSITTSIFESRRKPLVDLARPTHKEVRLYHMHKQYEESKGKFGKQLSSNSPLVKYGLKDHKPLSPFLLQQALEGLYQFGRYREFKIAFWQSIDTYGGIRIRSGLIKKVDADRNVIPKRYNYYQHPKRLLKDFIKDARPKNFDKAAVDNHLLDDVLYKFTKINGDGKTSLQSIVDFSTYVTMVQRLRIEDFQSHLESALMSELNYWTDYYHDEYMESLLPEQRENPPHRGGIRYAQMWKIMDAFDQIMTCFYSSYNFERGDRKFYNIDNPQLTAFVDRFLSRLYDTQVLKCQEEEALRTHKWFVKCGIMFFKPKELCSPVEEDLFNQTIKPSLTYLQEYYKNAEKKMEGFKLKNAIDALVSITPAQYAKWKTKKDPSEKEWYMRLKYLYLKLKLGTGR